MGQFVAYAMCVFLIVVLICVIISFPSKEKTPEEMTVIWKDEISYIPTEPCEGMILPEDILEMDGFNEAVCLIAQVLWGESRGLSDYENSLVAWCILNRVDSLEFPNTIKDVIFQPGQFSGYKASNPIDARLYDISKDVIIRWNMEGLITGQVGRTLPKEYLYFYGKDGHNKFRVRNSDPEGFYDFTDIYPNPYEYQDI